MDTRVMLHDLIKFDKCANVALLIKKKKKKKKRSVNKSLTGE